MKRIFLVFTLLSSLVFSITYQYNGEKFTLDDKKIERAFILSINNFRQQYGDSINEEELKVLVLNDLLEKEALLKSSFSKKIIIPEDFIKREIDSIKSQFTNDNVFFETLKNDGFTLDTLSEELKNNILWEKVTESIQSQTQVSDDEIKDYYEKNKFNSAFIGKSYEQVKNSIYNSLLEKKKSEILRYFEEVELSKISLENSLIYSQFYPKVVYEKEGFKFTNVDFANKKIMMRLNGILDEVSLESSTKEWIDNELITVREAKALNLLIPKNLSKADSILAYNDAYLNKLIETTQVDNNELKNYFESNIENYRTQETYDVNIIEFPLEISDLDKKEAKTKAQDILKLALSNSDFSELAKKYSEDGSAKDGGDLGWFSRGEMVSSFEEAAFNGKVGKVIPNLIETEFGYHIVKIEDKKSDGTQVHARHIIIIPKLGSTTVQRTKDKMEMMVNQIKTGKKTFEDFAKDLELTPDDYVFENLIKDEYISGIGEYLKLNNAISTAKVNEINYVIDESAFMFVKTKHINGVEPILENLIERVKFDLIQEKSKAKWAELYQ